MYIEYTVIMIILVLIFNGEWLSLLFVNFNGIDEIQQVQRASIVL